MKNKLQWLRKHIEIVCLAAMLMENNRKTNNKTKRLDELIVSNSFNIHQDYVLKELILA